MKILIVSDTHHRDANLKQVLEMEKPLDKVIHLGDAEESEWGIRQMVECPLDIVRGNNDFMGDMPKEKEIELLGYRTLLTHGHTYYVSLDTKILAQEARARGFHIAMYGHTHRPRIEEREGVILLNPGSLSYPRQSGRQPSYMVMEIQKNKRPECVIKYLNEQNNG